MARQYVITEEEMLSLIESLELHKMRENNLATSEKMTKDDMHRAFHYVVVRWAQSVGFDGYRK